MAIDLLHSFFQRGNQITSKTDVPSKQEISSKEASALPANQQILRAVRALQAGQTLQGEILSVKGEQVQLEVLKQVIIDARLSGALNLTPGTNMTFQVKGNQGGSLSLIPLFTNISTDPNVVKALEMAGININERSTQMVQTMMEKGMSVNKQSLMEMYRDVVSHKESPVTDIVTLKQMQLPLTEESLQQFSVYKNNQHLLSETFVAIGKDLGKQLEQWMAEGKAGKASHLLQELHRIFEASASSSEEIGKGTLEGNRNVTELPGKMVEDPQIQKAAIQEELLLKEGTELIKEGIPQEENALSQARGQGAEESGKLLSPFEKLAEMIKSQKTPDKLANFFERIWNREIREQWLLKPEDIEKKENISKLYERLDQQIKQLEKVLEDQVSSQSPVAKMVHNASANLDFMNQVNQMHAYIQLPMKMMNQNATGELYVFTNRKSLQEKEGKVTALLHLDMEYLGKLDIHVALENNKVATNFYLEKEEYLDFLEEHMELLTSRLKKRGYDCTARAVLRKEEEMQEGLLTRSSILEKGQTLLSTQAFDMRA